MTARAKSGAILIDRGTKRLLRLLRDGGWRRRADAATVERENARFLVAGRRTAL